MPPIPLSLWFLVRCPWGSQLDGGVLAFRDLDDALALTARPPRALVAAILRRIDRLRGPPVPAM